MVTGSQVLTVIMFVRIVVAKKQKHDFYFFVF